MSFSRYLVTSCLVASMGFAVGCTRYQVTKDVWKGTKSLWHEYFSPPASIDYDEKGEMDEQALTLAQGMIGIDTELTKLERVMWNADKPPTKGWLNEFFVTLPWVEGFAGIKSDGTVLGQEVVPGKPTRTIDYNPLLYEDAKQNTRFMRCDVQQTEHGPVVTAAMPIYDGIDFLGVVATYFDMSELTKLAKNPQEVIVLSPLGLLWPGRFDFAATPLAGEDWKEQVKKSSSGTLSNANGSFVYQVRFLGNLPLIFAVPASGSFPSASGDPLAQLTKFCPKREKMAPPPQKPKAEKKDLFAQQGGQPASAEEEALRKAEAEEAAEAEATARRIKQDYEAQQAKMMQMRQQQMQQLRQQQMARIKKFEAMRQRLMREEALGEAEAQRDATLQQQEQSQERVAQPSPFGPRKESKEKASSPAPEQKEATPPKKEETEEQPITPTVKPRATLSDGRMSPFGSRKAATE